VLQAFLDHLEASQVVTQAFEIRQALEGALGAFRAAVASGARAGRRAPAAQDPFVHRAAKLGRNDPCSCGSGKKYKKCHGRDA
jgi:preprotein translocase subunit SecA